MYKELLTNPKQHDLENFIYITHGVISGGGRPRKDVVEYAVSKIKNHEEFYRASLIGKLTAENAKKLLGYDGSVSRIAPFGPEGLIVEPQNDDAIQIAWSHDLSSPKHPQYSEWVKSHKGKIKTPLDILTYTLIGHNEMALRGDTKTNIAGVFYVAISPKIPVRRELADIVSEIEGQEIPLVPLPFPSEIMRELSDAEALKIQSELNQSLQEFRKVK